MPVINPTTVAVTGQPALGGGILLIPGTNVTLNQAGQQITINSSGGGSGPSTPGPPGADGEAGDDGVAIPGPAGPQGNPGSQGIAGAPGVSMIGMDGLDADDVYQIPGPPGAAGTPGTSGINGAPGAVFYMEGDSGDDGAMGPPGPQGPAGSSGSSNKGTAIIDFSTGKLDTSVAVTGQASITTGNLPQAWLSGTASSNNLNDAGFAEDMLIFAGDIVAGTGFTIYAFCKFGRAFGQYNVNWSWL
jgi:hypothetical protein